MRDPYRVIVWGPGAVGTAVLRLLHGRPEFELVGVLCHSPSKDGVDVGEYIGKEPTGLKISSDRDAVLGTDADVVLFTGQLPLDPEAMDADTIALLESGKNVISATWYFYPPFHGDEYAEKIEAACRKGNASIHGTGEQPGIFFERIAMALTGVCMEVEHLRMEEFVNVGRTSLETMAAFGVNRPLEEAQQPNPVVERLLTSVFGEQLSLCARSLYGKRPEIKMETEFTVAEEDVVLDSGTIQKGNVSNLAYTFTASIDGTVRLTTVINWVFSGHDRWIIELEGDPVSIKADMSGFATLDGELEHRPGDPTSVTSYVTATPIVQAIPVVCEAPAGIVYPNLFASKVPDLRSLGGRASIVDNVELAAPVAG
jgi:hypothetical protein